MSEQLFDRAGRRRSPATMPGFHAGRPPRNKGLRYPADPPTVEEIVAVMRAAGGGRHGRRLRALIVVLWRAGLRIHEALALRVEYANVDQLPACLVGACLPSVDERQRQLLPRGTQVAGHFVEQGERAVLCQPVKAARLRQRTCLHGSAITTGSGFVAAAIAVLGRV